MKDKMIRCIRCHGRKKMYKFNNGYTHANMGAPEVDCPMCLGKGVHKTFEQVIDDNQIEKKEIETENLIEQPIKKDFKHDEKKRPAKKESR